VFPGVSVVAAKEFGGDYPSRLPTTELPQPGEGHKGTLVARARVVRQGRRVGVCDVDVEQAAIIVAKGLFTYLFLEAKA